MRTIIQVTTMFIRNNFASLKEKFSPDEINEFLKFLKDALKEVNSINPFRRSINNLEKKIESSESQFQSK